MLPKVTSTRLVVMLLVLGASIFSFVVSTSRPEAAVISLGLGLASLVALIPFAGLYLALSFEFFFLVFGLVGLDRNIVAAAAFGSLLLEAIVGLSESRARLAFTNKFGSVLLVATVAWGSVVGVASHSTFDAINALRVFVLPLIAFACIRNMSRFQLSRLLTFIGVAMVLNAIASVFEFILGSDALIAAGLNYGTEIRQIGGVLRAPGLTRSNASLGLIAGFYLLGLFIFFGKWQFSRSRRLLQPVIISSIVCVLLSTTRTAIVVLAVGLLLQRVSFKNSVRNGLFTVVMLTGFYIFGAGSADSAIARLSVWANALSTVDLMGSGFGSVGSTTYSDLSLGKGAFTDNYFISLIQQFGVFGVILSVAAVGYAFALRRGDGPISALWGPVYAALIVASLIIEAWEYWAAMAVMLVWLRCSQVLYEEDLNADSHASSISSSAGRG